MRFYYAPGARSLAVHIALREIRANFEGVAVDLAKQTTADDANSWFIADLLGEGEGAQNDPRQMFGPAKIRSIGSAKCVVRGHGRQNVDRHLTS